MSAVHETISTDRKNSPLRKKRPLFKKHADQSKKASDASDRYNDLNLVTTTSAPVQEVQLRVESLINQAINKTLPTGDKETWFFRSDTGTGKTTGFVQAIRNSTNSFAIAVPTMSDVDSIYKELLSLDVDVFPWHTYSGTDKKDGKEFRVVVGTHAFMLSEKNDPTRHIGQKDILIIDEVPSTAKAKAIQQSDIVKAREFAEAYLSTELKDGFRALEEWVQLRHGNAVDHGGNAAFNPIGVRYRPALLDAETEIAAIPDEGAKHKLREVIEFLGAVKEQRAFERVKRGPSGHSMYYCWFAFPANNFQKQIVFSATCHLDGLQFSPNGGKIESEYSGFDVNYEHLSVYSVPYPRDLPKAVSQFGLADFEKAYDHVIAMVEHSAYKPENREILVVCPKRLKESVAYRHDVAKDADTFTVNMMHKTAPSDEVRESRVHFTNWGRDVGSNEYRDCRAVILWNNHHKPKHSTLSELFHYSEEAVTQSKLKPVTNGRFKGTRAGSLETDQLYAAIKQMGARGQCRMIDDNGKCAPMDLSISWSNLDETEVQKVFPGSKFIPVRSENPLLQPKPKGAMVKVIGYLKDTTLDEVTYKDLEDVISKPRAHAKRFKLETVLLGCNGWQFVQGSRGKHGTPSKFVRLPER